MPVSKIYCLFVKSTSRTIAKKHYLAIMKVGCMPFSLLKDIRIREGFMNLFFKRKSFFRRFLISYAIVLLIPFLTVLLTYFTAEHTVREEILNSSANSLHQFFKVVDSRLSEMEHTAFQALNNTSVKAQARRTRLPAIENAYSVHEARRALSSLPTDILSDLFVYCWESDSVISAANSSLSMEEYFSVYYAMLFNGSRDDFRSAVAREKTNAPQLISLGDSAAGTSLAMVLSQNSDYELGKPNISVCLVLKPSVLEEMLKSADFQQDSILLIFDGNGQKLAGFQDLPGPLNLEAIRGQGPKQETIGGKQYVVQLFDSNILNCTYASLTPTSSFWSRLNTLRAICLVSLFFCMLISAGVAVVLARRSFHPIISLLLTIRSKTSRTYDGQKENEMEFIDQILRQSLEENHLLSSRIRTEKRALREDFLLRALQGVMIQEPEGEEDAFTYHGITLLSDRFEVLLIRVESFEERLVGRKGTWDGQRTLSFIFSNVFEELSAIHHQGFLINLGPAEFAGIINFSSNSGDCLADTRDICRQLTEFLKPHFGIICTVSLSEIQSGLSGIHLGYRQAGQAMSYRFVCGKGGQIYYGDIAGRPFSFNSTADARAARILLGYIQQDRPECLEECIRLVWDSASIGQDSSLEAIRCFKYDMVNNLNKILHDIDTVPMEQDMQMISRLLDAETLEEFRCLLTEAAEQFRLRRMCSRESSAVCKKAIAYIRENYTDTNLNNNALGEALGLSPSYLSKLFKAQNGMAPLDYLYEIRLGRVKELLKSTDQTMDEIAPQAGFINGNALIKAFKKTEGITPGTFRKLTQPH